MARQNRLLIASLLAAILPVSAQEPEPAGQNAGFREKRPDARRQEPPSPEFENVLKALEALSPEQRKRFRENFLRWSNLPPNEKRALRE